MKSRSTMSPFPPLAASAHINRYLNMRMLLLLIGILQFALPAFGQGVIDAKPLLDFSCSAQVAEAFGREIMEIFIQDTGIQVNLNVNSSQTALDRLKNGFAHIAGCARQLESSDRIAGFVEIPFCRDPLAIIVNRQCPIDNLSQRQIRDVFSGKTTNWKDLGGPDQSILVVVPGETTAARLNFTRQAMSGTSIRFDFETDQSTAAIQGVKYLSGAISFIAQGAIASEEAVQPIRVDGSSVRDADYPFFQIFSLVTRGMPSGPVRRTINYALSDKGRQIIRNKGMHPAIEWVQLEAGSETPIEYRHVP